MGSSIIVHLLELNRCRETVAIFVAGAYAIQSLAGAVGVDGPPAADEKTPPAGSAYDLGRRQLERAIKLRIAIDRARAGGNFEMDVRLLGLRIVFDARLNMVLVKTIFGQYDIEPGNGGLQVVFAKGCPRLRPAAPTAGRRWEDRNRRWPKHAHKPTVA